MKKFLFAVVCVVFVSCQLDYNDHPSAVCEKGVPFMDITEYKYKNHDYIKFSDGNQAAVSHNPECTNPECVKIRTTLLKLSDNQ